MTLLKEKTLNWRRLKPSPIFFLQIVIFVGCLSLILNLDNTELVLNKKASTKIAVKPELLSHMTLGFHMVLADIMWLRLIQDIDYRESLKPEEGWVYRMLDAITTLNKRYRIAYSSGATMLSVLINDKKGSAELFDKGIMNFPDDWILLYKAAYHNLYELKECTKAADLFKKAAMNGAPKWVVSLSARLYTHSGQADIARSVLLESIQKLKGTEMEKTLLQRLAEVNEAEKKRVIQSLSDEDKFCLPSVKLATPKEQ